MQLPDDTPREKAEGKGKLIAWLECRASPLYMFLFGVPVVSFGLVGEAKMLDMQMVLALVDMLWWG